MRNKTRWICLCVAGLSAFLSTGAWAAEMGVLLGDRQASPPGEGVPVQAAAAHPDDATGTPSVAAPNLTPYKPTGW